MLIAIYIDDLIAFGVISIVASAFLGDISEYMDDHVAVVMH
jgi:hypothetical protein